MIRGAGAMIVVLLVVALSACASEPDPAPTQELTEEEAYAAAEETYRAYVDALNRVDLADPATFEPVYALTTGDANADERESLSSMHAEGLNVSGSSELVAFRGEEYVAVPFAVTAIACLDVSSVNVTDPSGTSRVGNDRPNQYPLEIEIVGGEPSHDRLLIASSRAIEDPECAR